MSLKDPLAVVCVKGLGAAPIAFVHRARRARGLAVAGAWSPARWRSARCRTASSLCALRARDATLGAARTGVLFAAAPFVGAALAIPIAGESPSLRVAAAAVLIAAGVALLLTERHGHRHRHEPLDHEHLHTHDEHHQHPHRGDEGPEPHAHPHHHDPIEHTHPHASTRTTATNTRGLRPHLRGMLAAYVLASSVTGRSPLPRALRACAAICLPELRPRLWRVRASMSAESEID